VPTYEYACRACGEHREVVQSFSDPALTTCESCGGELRKVFSAAGLIFKGSGWHVKDYAGSGRPPVRSGEAGGAGGGDAAPSATSADPAPSAAPAAAPTAAPAAPAAGPTPAA
jgi:putative FmdB family regulatory protein